MNRRLIRAAAVATVLVAALAGCTSTPEPVETPTSSSALGIQVTSIAALGDSITAGVSACGDANSCPSASWAVGDDPEVDSIATRVAEAGQAAPAVENFARKGAVVADLATQVPQAIEAAPSLVTVLIGSNDVCARSTTVMTDADTFASTATAALQALSTGLPDSTIYVSSIPDLLAFFELERGDASAQRLWAGGGCNSLLANPDSDAEIDVNRRDKIGALIDSYNTSLGEACSALSNCVYDGGALHELDVTADDISDVDHFHPSLTGQAALAETAWTALVAARP
ncbi:SGNH/GDSL hydrolase family protein [Microbacteriaceae bacterium VKM Ac-2855]|nr:SGNH/GDSL hydrolase family protein [Microbacteriaceae bacterium VKM Ac-2855]